MAQLSTTSYKNLYGNSGSEFPDNTSAEISEGDMRTFGENTADSFINRTDHLLDEDDMASDSATKVPSQQSTKAYVDARTGGGTGLLSSSVNVSSAEVLSLWSSPKEIVAAPGSGKYIELIRAGIFLDYNTTAYATQAQVLFYYSSGLIISSSAAILDKTQDYLIAVAGFSTNSNWSNFDNRALQLRGAGSDPTLGDSPLIVKVLYRIITI